MSDPSIADAVENALREFLATNAGGFPLGFLAIAEYVDSEGKTIPVVIEMNDQTTIRSMGFAGYLNEWYKDDARVGWAAEVWSRGDELDS